MALLARLTFTVMLCAGLTACAALLPAVILPQVVATVGVAGLSAVTCATDPLCEMQAPRCVDPAGKNIEVTESSDIGIPADEGKVATFLPTYWQPQFVMQGASQAERPLEATAGTFAVTDKSAVFVPPPGMDGVQIPLAGVLNVELQLNPSTGAPRQMTVESCFGRLDRFTFGQRQQMGRLDSEATATAAAEIKTRIAAARTAGKN
jgi:hypothetical protein